ncbi:MAG: amidohydrolase, partial [Flavobacteriales bacterium]|nr:amidohydrolase [Flavobacteriales bacterium]
GAYGAPDVPAPNTLVFRHATVWTNGPDGILRDADVLVHEGRITAVGRGLDPALFFTGKKRPTVTEVDATGRHLTCGIIDEHSHIAISRGVNEGGQASSAEVRMGDVVDPDDVSIYRDLAGGVTAAQLLHGSANPIGGQSALIKLRWGSPADSLLIDGADGFIKFALGENVKQSNWGNATGRFPQTRMGVEQFYYEAFHRARAYDREWRLWRSL